MIWGGNKDTKMANKYFIALNGTKHMHQATVGWKILVEWANGSCQCIALKILKESNPVQVTENAMTCNIADEAAFTWWVKYVLQIRDVIVLAVNSRVCNISHKYGIEISCSVKHAIEIDPKNKNTIWTDSLAEERENVCVAFKILGPNVKVPPGWSKALGHNIFTLRWILLKRHIGLMMVTNFLTPQCLALLVLFPMTAFKLHYLMWLYLAFLFLGLGQEMHISKLLARRSTSSFVVLSLGFKMRAVLH
jgi:hypothetical protein